MRISIILCTYNRSQSLSSAVESVLASAAQLPPGAEWELLIVDNNSKDQTRDVAAKFVQSFPGRCRYVFESRQGKSWALNTGVTEAAGDVLAFVDDDVLVDTAWLNNLTRVLQDERWAGSGGRILPERDFVPPPWLSLEGRYALAPLAIFDLGTRAGELKEAPFGTNMAFRSEVFKKVGLFRTDLGPQPGSEIRGEDTELGVRVLDAGLRLAYEPEAIVYHSLPQHRLRKEYFLAWWYDKARSDLRSTPHIAKSSMAIAGMPLFAFRRLAVWTCRWISSVKPARRFSNRIKVWSVLGMMAESRRMTRERNSPGISERTPS